jgi:hypothetical protein
MYVHAYVRMYVCVNACMYVCACVRATVVHKFCVTDREARLNFVNWCLRKVLAEQIHRTFIRLVRKIGFISADTSLKTTATGLQKIPCESTQCHYMMVQFVCALL